MTDPEVLRRTLPGCQKFERRPDGSYDIAMSVGIASIRGTFTGSVHLLDERPPDSYTLKLSAQGAVGFVNGYGDFVLKPAGEDGDGTVVSYTGEAQVGGKIAGVGQRLLQSGANLIIGQFFKAMDREVAARTGEHS
jgi:carbon monoxide dehydrogenase subunit G